MKPGRFYKHTNMRDVTLQVLDAAKGKTHYTVKCIWYNTAWRKFGYEMFPIGPEKIKIKNENMEDWGEYAISK